MSSAALILRELLILLADRLLRYADKRLRARNRETGADVRSADDAKK